MNSNLQLYLSLLSNLHSSKQQAIELLDKTNDEAIRDSLNLIEASIKDLTTSRTAKELIGK